jgi:SulP family sulfate permease
VTLHLSEVKGPVMDRLKKSHFLHDLSGRVFLSQYQAWQALAGPGVDRGVQSVAGQSVLSPSVLGQSVARK